MNTRTFALAAALLLGEQFVFDSRIFERQQGDGHVERSILHSVGDVANIFDLRGA